MISKTLRYFIDESSLSIEELIEMGLDAPMEVFIPYAKQLNKQDIKDFNDAIEFRKNEKEYLEKSLKNL